jgi:hypothetical protein
MMHGSAVTDSGERSWTRAGSLYLQVVMRPGRVERRLSSRVEDDHDHRYSFAKISDALCPPKPIELESAVVMLRARALLGT